MKRASSASTGKQAILEALSTASTALGIAYEALQDASPHCCVLITPQGAAPFGTVATQHRDRLRKVNEVKNTINALIFELC